MAQAVRVNSGLKTFVFEDANGEELGRVRFNPNDLAMSGRWSEAEKKLQEYLETFTEADDFAKISELDRKIKECLDYVFNAPISAVLFAGGSSLAVCEDGALALENALDAVTPLLQEAQEAAVKASAARIAKHAAKYEGSTEGLAEGQK